MSERSCVGIYPSTRSLRSLVQGIRRHWPAMSEPGGSPQADRQVSRMEAAGVVLRGGTETKGLQGIPIGPKLEKLSNDPVYTRITHAESTSARSNPTLFKPILRQHHSTRFAVPLRTSKTRILATAQDVSSGSDLRRGGLLNTSF